MPNPYDDFDDAPVRRSLTAGDPRRPSEIRKTRNEAIASDLAPEQARTSLIKDKADIARDDRKEGYERQDRKFEEAAALRDKFMADPRTKKFMNAMPGYVASLQTEPTAAGDMVLVYAAAKTMDPDGAVRGEDAEMVGDTDSLYGKTVARLTKELSDNGGKFRPEVRTRIRRELRNLVDQHIAGHNEAREMYGKWAERYNLDPYDVVGENAGKAYADDVDAYAQRLRGANKDSVGLAIEGGEVVPEIVGGSVGSPHQQPQAPQPPAGPDWRDLKGLTKGFLHTWDRAATGVEDGLNAALGLNLNSAQEAMESRRTAPLLQGPVNPTTEMFGRIGGGALFSAPFGGPVAQGAVAGALMGDGTGFNVGRDAALGAIGGKVADTAVRGTAQLLAPRLEEPVRNLVREGAQLTPGRFFPSLKKAEDLARSYPVVGGKIDEALNVAETSVNRIPANRALGHIGQRLPDDVPAGHAAVDYTQRTLGSGYDNTLAGREAALDPTFITRMNYIGQRGGLRPQEADTLNDIVQREIGGAFVNGRGRIAAKDFKRLTERIGKLGEGLKAHDDPFQRQLGESVGFVDDQLHALMRRQNPEAADQLRALDRGWADFVPYQRAASMAVDDGIASAGQFRSAVRQSDRSMRKGRTARGEANLQKFAADASEVIPATRGNSGTADRANLFNPYAWTMGALASPLYSKPALSAINRVAGREPDPVAKAIAEKLGLIRGGPLGAAFPLYIPGQ